MSKSFMQQAEALDSESCIINDSVVYQKDSEGTGAGMTGSGSGSGMHKEIRQIKALLGQLAQDFNVRVCQPRMPSNDNSFDLLSLNYHSSSALN